MILQVTEAACKILQATKIGIFKLEKKIMHERREIFFFSNLKCIYKYKNCQMLFEN